MNVTDLVICLVSLAVYFSAFTTIFFSLPGYELRKNRLPLIIAGILSVAATVTINYFVPTDDIYTVFDMLLVTVSLLTPYLVFVPKKKLTLFFFSGVVMIAFDYIRSFIISLMPSGEISERKKALVSCAIYLVTLILLAVFHGRISSKIPEGFIESISPFIYAIIYIAFFASSYESMLGRGDLYDSAISSVLKLISTGLIIVALFYLVSRYFKFFSKQKEAEMQLETELKHYEETMQKNQDIRRFRHDYKNNLISLRAFVEGGRNEEAKEYIDDLTGTLETAVMQYNTGNYLADAIVSEKAKAAEKQRIGIAFEGRIPAEGIKNSDLCTILANSIDNAVRACTQLAPCSIKIASQVKKSGVVITVSNPVKEKVTIKNNSIKTTKTDKLNHGLGIGNIKRTAAEYGGSVNLYCSDNEFSIEILLPV